MNSLIEEVQKSQPNAPKKLKRVKVIAEADKDAAKEAGSEAAKAIEADASEKPKRVLSPEHLAKLKAGREVSKAKKAAEEEAKKVAESNV